MRRSTPGAGVPTEPGLTTWPETCETTPPEVSVMPKPSSTSQPKRAANACSVSGGSGAPPTCATRSFGTGAPASAARRSAMHIDGTPRNTSADSRCISASAASASKRGSSAMQAPVASAGLSTPARPKMWLNGAAPSSTSSSRSRSSGPERKAALARRPACVSSAPFGRPVVPEV